jgi:predicted Zn-dependent protease
MQRVASVVTLSGMLVWSGCATNPATGEQQLSLISESQEIEMGREAAQEVDRTIGLLGDKELQSYVSRIGLEIASASERPTLPWRFQIVDDPTPNAFAIPGGFIYVTRGMLSLLTSEAELASVLGHEVAHVTARHSVGQISKQQLAQIGVGIGGLIFPEVQQAAPLLGAGLQVLFLKYSRDDEREADEIGFRYVNQRGYDVTEFGDVFATLERLDGSESGSLPSWLSTHPAPAERVETARQRAAQLPSTANQRIGRETFLRQLDGLVYGEDPRQGFFKENAFYHPELRFQLVFPRGWQMRNLPQAVVGSAPNGTALFELTLVQGENASAAYQRFTSRQGISAEAPSRSRVNGLTAVSGQFRASSGQTPVRGIAAFVEQRGRVYQLVGYSTERGFSAAAPALTGIINSFDTVDDPAILNVSPQRIDIVQADRTQTLNEFARRHRSAVPVERLALLNQVASPAARIEAGTLVKTVVS